MTPWNRSEHAPEACTFVSIYNQGHNLLLGKTPQATWTLYNRDWLQRKTFLSLDAALEEAYAIAACSFFEDDA
jgi:hypothetical protein